MSKCSICHRPLGVASDPLSLDCGGDCLACMAEAGDPECIEDVREFAGANPDSPLLTAGLRQVLAEPRGMSWAEALEQANAERASEGRTDSA